MAWPFFDRSGFVIMIGWETRAGQKFRFDGFWRNTVPRKFNFLRFKILHCSNALHLEISEWVSERSYFLKLNVLFLNTSTDWLTNTQLISIRYFKGSGEKSVKILLILDAMHWVHVPLHVWFVFHSGLKEGVLHNTYSNIHINDLLLHWNETT